MIKIKNTHVDNFPAAIRGMRNPLESWERSDSFPVTRNDSTIKNSGMFKGFRNIENITISGYVIGKSDIELMKKLYAAGSEHAKYLRQINVSFDITAPIYWWKEWDTYKIGTVANSTSTMHTIHKRDIILDDFSHDYLDDLGLAALRETIDLLNYYRVKFIETNDRAYWNSIIQLLPSSYNQTRTISTNYAVIMNMINQRRGHKLKEWRDLVTYFVRLPYIAEIRGEDIE